MLQPTVVSRSEASSPMYHEALASSLAGSGKRLPGKNSRAYSFHPVATKTQAEALLQPTVVPRSEASSLAGSGKRLPGKNSRAYSFHPVATKTLAEALLQPTVTADLH